MIDLAVEQRRQEEQDYKNKVAHRFSQELKELGTEGLQVMQTAYVATCNKLRTVYQLNNYELLDMHFHMRNHSLPEKFRSWAFTLRQIIDDGLAWKSRILSGQHKTPAEAVDSLPISLLRTCAFYYDQWASLDRATRDAEENNEADPGYGTEMAILAGNMDPMCLVETCVVLARFRKAGMPCYKLSKGMAEAMYLTDTHKVGTRIPELPADTILIELPGTPPDFKRASLDVPNLYCAYLSPAENNTFLISLSSHYEATKGLPSVVDAAHLLRTMSGYAPADPTVQNLYGLFAVLFNTVAYLSTSSPEVERVEPKGKVAKTTRQAEKWMQAPKYPYYLVGRSMKIEADPTLATVLGGDTPGGWDMGLVNPISGRTTPIWTMPKVRAETLKSIRKGKCALLKVPGNVFHSGGQP